MNNITPAMISKLRKRKPLGRAHLYVKTKKLNAPALVRVRIYCKNRGIR